MGLLLAGGLVHGADSGGYGGTLTAKVGYDSNLFATGGNAAALLGQPESAFLAAGSTAYLSHRTSRVSYTAEAFSFLESSTEDFVTHRIALEHRGRGERWSSSLDVSSLFIDGDDHSFAQTTSASGNAIALMRDRRRQWQHRGKAQFLSTWEGGYVLTTVNVLDIDYHTQAEAGKWVFTDRRDVMMGLDLGRNPRNSWYVGARLGQQHQASSPLPGVSFDASNRYHRLIAGWEMKPQSGRSLSVAVGPDVRSFRGHFDRRLLPDGRFTSLWCEASGALPVGKTASLSAKVTRWMFLSSVGKSAYVDTVGEVGIIWRIRPFLSAKTSCRVQQTDYVLALRDDWQMHLSTEVSLQLTKQLMLRMELVDNQGWDGLAGSNDRAFSRRTGCVGLTRPF